MARITVHAAALFAGALFASAAHSEINADQCALAGCSVGEVVSITPTIMSGPGCYRLGIAIYVGFARLTHDESEEGRLAVERLRLEAGVRSMDEALRFCEPTQAGKRVKIIEFGSPKTGMAKVEPVGGGAPVWVSTFDISRQQAR